MSKSPLTPPPESAVRRRWRERILLQQHSGLSQAVFCRRHGFSPQTFSFYKRRLGYSSTPPMSPAAPPSFLPLRVCSAPSPFPPPRSDAAWIEVWLCNGRRLRAPLSVEGSDLQRLVAALEGGP